MKIARSGKNLRHKLITKKTRHNKNCDSLNYDKNVDSLQTEDSFERVQQPTAPSMLELPYSHLFFSKKVARTNQMKHLSECYFGIKHIQNMLPLTPEQLEKHRLELPTPNLNQKTLFLDLDETLIHASLDPNVRLEHSFFLEVGEQKVEITFAVRPHCVQFLREVAQHYEVYIFTASNQEYARAAMEFFNSQGANITGYLARQACLKTSRGLYIKDIMRVVNRSPKQMILVDNLTHSFGHMIDNGVPVLEFVGDKDDHELIELGKYLVECAQADDVREFNRARLRLGGIVEGLSPYLHIVCA